MTDYMVSETEGGLFVARTAIGFQPGVVMPLSLPVSSDEEEDDEA